MRKKQDILDVLVSSQGDKDVDFYTKLCFLEVLVDIRDTLDAIRWKR